VDICFISHSASIGGAEEVLVETLEVLSNRGMNCRVLLPERGKLCDELNRLRIPFSIVPYGCWVSRGKQDFWKRLKSIARHLATIPAIVWLIRQWSCDVVYSNTSTICVGAIVAAILRRPHVWHIHEFGYEDHGLLFLFGERFSLKVMNLLSSTCICPSQAVKAKYARFIPPSKLNMLYCSMHHAREKGGGEDKATLSIPLRRHSFRCVIVGSVIEGKGQEEAVNAIAELAGSNMKAELLIVWANK
jgi:glycosyltransferase involved in cell wall biosynthesis